MVVPQDEGLPEIQLVCSEPFPVDVLGPVHEDCIKWESVHAVLMIDTLIVFKSEV